MPTISLDALLTWLSHSQPVVMYTNPLVLGLIAAILVAERFLPARPAQPVFSRGFGLDATYLVITHLSGFAIHVLWVALLRRCYDAWLGFLTVESIAAWPVALAGMLGILLNDLISWVHHWARHRLPILWRLHAVHHSQRDLNVFTDLRYHPLEYLVTTTMAAIPQFALGNALSVVAGWGLVVRCFNMATHANVRTRFGWLRFVLVTPQSHRLHHSIEAGHRGHNFGSVFSFWDRLFGTRHPSDDAYPETGIADPRGAGEWTRDRSLVSALAADFALPFRSKPVLDIGTRSAPPSAASAGVG